MTEIVSQGALSRRLLVLLGTIQPWKQYFGDALAAQGPVAEDERVEYLVGLLDPDDSWQAVIAEAVDAFPGTMARSDAILGELVAVIRELVISDVLLCSVEEVVGRLGPALSSVRHQAAEHPGLAAAVADLDEALAAVGQLGRAGRIASERREPPLGVPDLTLPAGHNGVV